MNPHKSDRSDPAVLHTETAHPEHTAGYGDGSYKNRAHTYLTYQGLRSFQGWRTFRKTDTHKRVQVSSVALNNSVRVPIVTANSIFLSIYFNNSSTGGTAIRVLFLQTETETWKESPTE